MSLILLEILKIHLNTQFFQQNKKISRIIINSNPMLFYIFAQEFSSFCKEEMFKKVPYKHIDIHHQADYKVLFLPVKNTLH